MVSMSRMVQAAAGRLRFVFVVQDADRGGDRYIGFDRFSQFVNFLVCAVQAPECPDVVGHHARDASSLTWQPRGICCVRLVVDNMSRMWYDRQASAEHGI